MIIAENKVIFIVNYLDYYFPSEPGYDTSFFICFLKGEKKLLKLSNHKDYKMKYYRSDNLLTKHHLVNLIKENNIYTRYLPDSVDLNKLSKDYLFTLIASLDAQTYSQLYAAYKNKESSKVFKKWDEYEVSLPENVLGSISLFNPVHSHLTNTKNFRLSKNHIPTNLFSHSGENNILNDKNDKGAHQNIINEKDVIYGNEEMGLAKGNKIKINLESFKERNQENEINEIIEEE